MGKHFFDYEDGDKNNGGREKVGPLAATSPYTDKLIFFNG